MHEMNYLIKFHEAEARERIEETLALAKNSIAEAAEAMGVSHWTLRRWIKALDIEVTRTPSKYLEPDLVKWLSNHGLASLDDWAKRAKVPAITIYMARSRGTASDTTLAKLAKASRETVEHVRSVLFSAPKKRTKK